MIGKTKTKRRRNVPSHNSSPLTQVPVCVHLADRAGGFECNIVTVFVGKAFDMMYVKSVQFSKFVFAGKCSIDNAGQRGVCT
mmetsp:Transcript_11919/g.17252  ORF Transcript_11919/g.17252 Transcript_11919/m.17252 type:complete len:82 (+) Transcript_11919:871-1116(+)